MAEVRTSADTVLTAAAQADRARVTMTEIVAICLSLLWIVVAVVFFVASWRADDTGSGVNSGPSLDSLRFIITLLAIFLPVAMIWVAASAARSSRIVREESRRLQVAIDAMRQTYLADRQARGSGGVQPTVEKKLNEIAQATRATESTVASFASGRAAQARATPFHSTRAAPVDDQPKLALGTSAEEFQPPLGKAEMIRALNFPDTEKDEVGFAALRRALKDRQARQLVQASQDVLTLLSQDGIYMDDLRPDRARPEIWRRFAKGERGRAIAALGGVRDRSCLALTVGRMRGDTIFRDAAHHFLRKFDQMLVVFEETATDEEIADLSETRTARAFMLLGRVTGAFD